MAAEDVSSALVQDAVEGLAPELRSGVERLLAAVPSEDLAEREARDVVGGLASMWKLAAHREPGQTLVRVFTPTVREDGWTSRRTIVGVCTDDAPFLVDSVDAAIARHGYTVHQLLHPVVEARRDDSGALLAIGAHGGRLESWMLLETDRIATEEDRGALAERLRDVVGDVHSSVEDWAAMRRACLDICTDLRTQPPATVDPATIAPTVEFLTWLAEDHFTFLGYREYALETENGEDVLRPLPHTGLGILRKPTTAVAHLRPEARRTAREPRLLTITKANSRATVHRDVYLDYIGVRTFDDEGNVTGERRILGMFTSTAYASSVLTLPIVGAKVRAVLDASGFAPTSHTGKDLQQILEQYPRDELFQDSVEHLSEVAGEVSRLRERRRSRIFLRRDEFGRFVSALVFLPRDRYNTTVRLRIEALLREAFDAERVEHTTRVGESPLAQLHFVVRVPRGASIPDVDPAEMQRQLEAAVRTWETALVDELHHTHDEHEAAEILGRYGSAFPEAYKEQVTPAAAVADIARLDSLTDAHPIAVHLYAPDGADPGARRLTIASFREYPLTQVLPMLTDLGVDVIDERPYTIRIPDGDRHISDFGLAAGDPGLWGDDRTAAAFEDAFCAVWAGAAESDILNSLVLRAGLRWRDIVILRAIGRYLRQIGSAFSMEYIDGALITHPRLAADLVRLFALRFDPDVSGDREEPARQAAAALLQDLDDVPSLDHDRILRSFIGVIGATWRTNFYTRDPSGAPKPWISMKLDCANVPGLPPPRPMTEIWVYSPQVEGVHLRFGKVARGGLRWSDRREDFRTEVLGLVKAQMVKNAVIVPTGSKGGFIAKQLPDTGDAAERLAEGKAAYRTFIRGMLDITDNRDGSVITPPDRVVRHDGDDSYLVVAADKGTASFSDVANGISQEYGFWLDDAFASGGSAGYDHKAMGITARGAWESVKRHFRELGHDTQTQDFTVVGVGDMSGDVFGNGMLLSEHIRLVAAFDHRHVFVDPDPDAATSRAERQRLFELPGSSWDDYDRGLISDGGGVFPLTAKSVPVSPRMAEALGLEPGVTSFTPAELKRAVLLARVDLLWNGGIGTYVKASTETNAEIGDRANDAIRVNGADLRVRVVGEGGNLGVSQRGRIEAALAGVHINTDAIDNSAGVGTSDREVNLKILLGAVMREGRMDRAARDELLQAVTDEVAAQVLRDNYEQNVLLGNSRANAAVMLPVHERFIEWLEARGDLDRDLEFLPDAGGLAARTAQGQGLTRPEFAVLVAYAKLALKSDLIETELADDPWFGRTLTAYFPAAVSEAYAGDLAEHPLRREIIVNAVVNSMVNRGGITFAFRAADETGASSEQIARAFVTAREILDLGGFVVAVEATDNVVDARVQTDLYLEFRRLLDRAARWFVQHRADRLDIGAEIEAFAGPVRRYASRMGDLLQGNEQTGFTDRVAELEAAGCDGALAARGAGLLASVPLLDVAELARSHGRELDEVARTYFTLSGRTRFDDLLTSVSDLPQEDRWDSMARAALRDDLYAVMVALTASVLEGTEPGDAADRIAAWVESGGAPARRALDALATAHAVERPGIATLSVALRQLRSLVR
ncbi:NAD-glutamate dehydrogenase [Beutenbergia cavernae DSM 12333]|uniref:NAD-glutamate dehydrogenase n=1 Tax=Beutenbergia cavernae (strain ATCC BAA-8 / DSM 12333 / CCUG 43141 / JCM 11478 / NBRC 16432 / NCIMB 13614 / HKI 0122) TaxID=471853 RepID=C5C3D2_BEUC1|nr:NAD-glutamate dehydrogenase [Beutenbergia cavernae]ACQ79831.1 NAD-glutamate dehydrogenase [Beutenbergia cavernae DSM 12333]